MATDETKTQNARLEAAFARLSAALRSAIPSPPALLGPDLFARAGLSDLAEAMSSPRKQLELQVASLSQAVAALEAAKAEGAQGLAPWFALLHATWAQSGAELMEIIQSLELPKAERARLAHFAEQMVEFLNPANFLATNPEALARAVETAGESWLRGLEHLAQDIEEGQGEATPRLADPAAFTLGQDLACTPGEVVLRTPLFELLQYHPLTEKVYRKPLLVVPPWINKFYVLDLRPENSFLRWAVAEGFTVFVMSWVNPNPSHAEKGLEAYVQEGILAALAEVRRRCRVKEVHSLGYCVAGTALAAALGLLAARKESGVASATFLTTMTDFSDQGQFGPYLGADFRGAIAQEAARQGLLPARYLARTFAYLRPRDLVYGPAQKRYLMGEPAPAFDLLVWNGDSTHLSSAMAQDLIETLWTQNRLAKGELQLCGQMIDLKALDLPIFAVSCEGDHIAPWQECLRSVQAMGGQKSFVLAGSGHVAGIINPPSRSRYGYRFVHGACTEDALSQARFEAGSWWPQWSYWLKALSGGKVPARAVQNSLGAAPGHYVVQPAWAPERVASRHELGA